MRCSKIHKNDYYGYIENKYKKYPENLPFIGYERRFSCIYPYSMILLRFSIKITKKQGIGKENLTYTLGGLLIELERHRELLISTNLPAFHQKSIPNSANQQ